MGTADNSFTCNRGNVNPTKKFADQLMKNAILIAAPRGPCENNSATISHGIDPVNKKKCK